MIGRDEVIDLEGTRVLNMSGTIFNHVNARLAASSEFQRTNIQEVRKPDCQVLFKSMTARASARYRNIIIRFRFCNGVCQEQKLLHLAELIVTVI